MNDDAASAQESFMDVTPQNLFYREIAWFKVQKGEEIMFHKVYEC